VGVHRTVDRIAHHIAYDEHTITVTLGDPIPVSGPYRYARPPSLTGAALLVPADATFTGPAAWEHAPKTFTQVAALGSNL
jgi:hypothetical protein